MEVEEVMIPVPWGQTTAKCWHSKMLRPALVAHGLNENAGSFDGLIPLLPKDFFYVVVDLPGHGFSSSFPGGLPLDFMNYVYQLDLIARHFQWKKFVLMGHSFGGHIAEFYAATFPNQVEKLILLESWSPTPVAKELFLDSFCNEIEEILKRKNKTQTLYSYSDALALMMNRRWSKLTSKAAVALLNRSLKTTDGGYVFDEDDRLRWEIRPRLDEDALLCIFTRIKCPVLILLGAESELSCFYYFSDFTKTVFDILKNSHPMSRIVRVDGNHCMHNNNPQAVAPVITRFLVETKSHL